MKKCDYFKDMILTDYLDGELDKYASAEVESHLHACTECHAFLKEVKKNAALPFQQVSHPSVPAELWDSIKQSIEHEDQAASPFAEFLDKLKGLIVFPRLVPVLASLILMLLAGSVTLNRVQIQQAQAKDQGEYLVSLLGSTDTTALSDNNEGGTPIEHYFL